MYECKNATIGKLNSFEYDPHMKQTFQIKCGDKFKLLGTARGNVIGQMLRGEHVASVSIRNEVFERNFIKL